MCPVYLGALAGCREQEKQQDPGTGAEKFPEAKCEDKPISSRGAARPGTRHSAPSPQKLAQVLVLPIPSFFLNEGQSLKRKPQKGEMQKPDFPWCFLRLQHLPGAVPPLVPLHAALCPPCPYSAPSCRAAGLEQGLEGCATRNKIPGKSKPRAHRQAGLSSKNLSSCPCFSAGESCPNHLCGFPRVSPSPCGSQRPQDTAKVRFSQMTIS